MPLIDLSEDEARLLADMARRDAERAASTHAPQLNQLADRLQAHEGEHVHVEYARAFDNPLPDDAPMLWGSEFHGEPDLSQPPPSASKGNPMHWVTRTVTTGPWRRVTDYPEPT